MKDTTCTTCSGLGTVPLKASYISTWFGKKKDGKPEAQIIETTTTCPKCKGAGQIKAT
jgi:DnaJ-class molecular chaperone